MRPDEKNQYKTKDLGECSALVTSGQKIINIQRDGKICWFVFGDTAKCEQISREFFFGNLQGNLRQYHEVMNVLKNRIFSYVR